MKIFINVDFILFFSAVGSAAIIFILSIKGFIVGVAHFVELSSRPSPMEFTSGRYYIVNKEILCSLPLSATSPISFGVKVTELRFSFSKRNLDNKIFTPNSLHLD